MKIKFPFLEKELQIYFNERANSRFTLYPALVDFEREVIAFYDNLSVDEQASWLMMFFSDDYDSMKQALAMGSLAMELYIQKVEQTKGISKEKMDKYLETLKDNCEDVYKDIHQIVSQHNYFKKIDERINRLASIFPELFIHTKGLPSQKLEFHHSYDIQSESIVSFSLDVFIEEPREAPENTYWRKDKYWGKTLNVKFFYESIFVEEDIDYDIRYVLTRKNITAVCFPNEKRTIDFLRGTGFKRQIHPVYEETL